MAATAVATGGALGMRDAEAGGPAPTGYGRVVPPADVDTVLDGVEIRSADEVVAYARVRDSGIPDGGGCPGALPLEAARQAVAELVRWARGPGWAVLVGEVASLRLFGPLAPGDLLVTEVTCRAAGHDERVVTVRCGRDGEPVARLTARLAVVPGGARGGPGEPPPTGSAEEARSTSGVGTPAATGREGRPAARRGDGQPADPARDAWRAAVPLGPREIRALLHPTDRLLVDRVTRCEPGMVIEALKAVGGGEPCFAGPRADHRYPEALLLDSFAQSAALLWARTLGRPFDGPPRFAGARGVTFHGPVPPGSLVRHVVKLVPGTDSTTFFRGRSCLVEGPQVLSVDNLVLTVRPQGAILRAAE